MSFNSSSSNDSPALPHIYNMSLPLDCLLTKPNIYVYKTFHAINIALMLPVCLFTLHHGLQQRRRKTTSKPTTSHSDCFTYHMVSMEMIGVFGSFFNIVAVSSENIYSFAVYSSLAKLIWHGQTLFHLLTCVERYLAVVHAIVYVRLKNKRGVRIRNVSICCVWLCCIVTMTLFRFEKVLVIVDFCLMVGSLAAISFCSSTALLILARPGPGEQNRDKLNQSKQKALYTIVSIFGVLMLRFSGSTTFIVAKFFEPYFSCQVMLAVVWFQLPSSLVLPLLYLQRTGNLGNCNKVKI